MKPKVTVHPIPDAIAAYQLMAHEYVHSGPQSREANVRYSARTAMARLWYSQGAITEMEDEPGLRYVLFFAWRMAVTQAAFEPSAN